MRTNRMDDGTVVAVPTTTTTPPVEASSAQVSPAAPAVPGAPRTGWTTWFTARRVCAIVGILVPLVVLTVWCSRLVPSFDGAMNLQVAWNLANGDGYVRFYGGESMFPDEIETSGAFIFIAAGFLK